MVAGSLQLVVAAVAALDRDGRQSPMCPLYDSILELHQDCLSLLRLAADDHDRWMLLVAEPDGEELLGRSIRMATARLPIVGSAEWTRLLRDVLRYLRVARALGSLSASSALRQAEDGSIRAETAVSRRWVAINISYAAARK